MKKITFLLILLIFQFNQAQDTCQTATAINVGVSSVDTIDGTFVNTCNWTGTQATNAEWYSFTATSNSIIIVSSDLAQNSGIDTRLSVLSGTCGALSCVGSDDDGGSGLLSTLSFTASAGETYYIQWDNRWDDAAFDFEITEQQNPCDTATAINSGVTSVGAIDNTFVNLCDLSNADNAVWFSYTSTIDGIVTLSSDLAQNSGLDTRLSVFSGTCEALSCLGSDDDGGDGLLSLLSFPVNNGETYYIQWDNRWDDSAFDFELTEDLVECQDGSLPFSDDFTDPNTALICWETIDADGDGIGWEAIDYDLNDDDIPDENPCLSSNSWNGAALTPDNWIISVALDLTTYSTSDDIELSWKARGIDADFANENYTVYAATGNQISDFTSSDVSFNEIIGQNGGAGQTFVDRSLDLSSLAGNMVYIAFRHHDVSDQFALNIDDIAINATLSTSEFENSSFNYAYYKDDQSLNIESSDNELSSLEIYSLLGQQVLNQKLTQHSEKIVISALKDGIYIAKVKNTQGATTSFKFIKN